MSTTFYLRDASQTQNLVAASWNKILSVDRGPAKALAETQFVAPSSSGPFSTIQIKKTISITDKTVVWWTNPLAGFTVSGDILFHVWGKRSDNDFDARLRAEIYHMNNTGAVLGLIASGINTSSYLGDAKPREITATVAVPEVIPAGDRLLVLLYVDVRRHTIIPMTRKATIYYDRETAGLSGDTFIVMAEDITEGTPDPGNSGSDEETGTVAECNP